MTKELAVELKPHKAEFSAPDDFDVTVDESKNFGAAISGGKNRFMYAEIVSGYPKQKTMKTLKRWESEATSKAQELCKRYSSLAHVSTLHDQLPGSISTAPKDENLDNHDGLYQKHTYDIGWIVERGSYWFNENIICDIYFIYLQNDAEMGGIIEEIKKSAKLTTTSVESNDR
jgi:hypothetical protein